MARGVTDWPGIAGCRGTAAALSLALTAVATASPAMTPQEAPAHFPGFRGEEIVFQIDLPKDRLSGEAFDLVTDGEGHWFPLVDGKHPQFKTHACVMITHDDRQMHRHGADIPTGTDGTAHYGLEWKAETLR